MTNTTVRVTKQLDLYPQHYPLYRGKASLTDDKRLTFASYTYNTVNCPINVSSTHASALTNMADALSTTLDELQPSSNVPNYIYTYSANVIKIGALPCVECELTYYDKFITD